MDFFFEIIWNNFLVSGWVVIIVFFLKLSLFLGFFSFLFVKDEGWNLLVERNLCIFFVIFGLIFFFLYNNLIIFGSVRRLWRFIFWYLSIFLLFWKWFNNIIVFVICRFVEESVLIVFKIFELFVMIFLIIRYLFFVVNIFFISCFVLYVLVFFFFIIIGIFCVIEMYEVMGKVVYGML